MSPLTETFRKLSGYDMKHILLTFLFLMALLPGLTAVAPATATEVEAVDRLYNHHQKFSLEAAHKLQALRQQYQGNLQSAPATLVVPLLDQAIRHMRWAKGYAPNEESRSILEYNARNLQRLRARIVNGQGKRPKKGVCTGNDAWITA
jgi:Skp family chaperone for outer membrane proteins